MPDPGNRYQALQCVSEDHSIPPTVYGPGFFDITQEWMGSRYAFCLVRTFANPHSELDMIEAHALQRKISLTQANAGRFSFPNWDEKSLGAMRQLLAEVAKTKSDTRGMFGLKEKLNPTDWLLGAAVGWGGNPPEAAIYDGAVVQNNDGKTAYVLQIPKDVPVDAFWSVTLYDAKGYVPKNSTHPSYNSVTAKKNADGSCTITFGGDGENNFALVEGWSYTVRLYRPRPEVISGLWRFPTAVEAKAK